MTRKDRNIVAIVTMNNRVASSGMKTNMSSSNFHRQEPSNLNPDGTAQGKAFLDNVFK